jgi:hypothetical protein
MLILMAILPWYLQLLDFQQAVTGISQISFSSEESISPKKPTSVPEVAKQRELSGTLQNDFDMKSNKLISNAKFKEISGHDIFAPPSEIAPRSLAAARSMETKENKDIGEPAPRNIRTSVRVSNVSVFFMCSINPFLYLIIYGSISILLGSYS